ncbi:transcription factor SCREAM-like protein [Thalictrum thalictroides]|uniref:Transcription factor SCREAM-like protein n=1 Tax=Thalictrum thalictroides TaxID=46969 RepID=A0A7J6XA04_THATH|nr:transcription factor SCREAM-like protein [Thalictrum thalictroides]
MVSRENKRTALYEKLQLLRSVTHSHALSNASIVIDATKYIKELKQKVESLNQDISSTSLPTQVTVETLEKGFLVNVFSERNCPGLLVAVLEAFEELGLNVIEARVSCTDSFRLEAVGGENQVNVDAQVVEQAVLQAVLAWNESNEQE